MPRCDTCARLTIEALRADDVILHESLSALKACAEEARCDFCQLCWTALQSATSADVIASTLRGEPPPDGTGSSDGNVDTRIWLQADLKDLYPAGWQGEATASQIWIGVGRQGGPAAGTSTATTWARLSLFADPETPAARRFAGRWITADRNAGHHMAFVSSLLASCERNHGPCALRPAAVQEMPTRVIDLGDGGVGGGSSNSNGSPPPSSSSSSSSSSPRLVITRGLIREPYLALSYCWGKGVRHETELNDGNIAHLLEGIDEGRLTRTHREVFGIARGLGIRYVWVDSLCIIQGNFADWSSESRRMAAVYGNASLTLIAGRAEDSRTGFASNTLLTSSPPCPIPYGRRGSAGETGSDDSNEDLGPVFASLPRSHRVGPVETRGWCFQESILSRRALIYGSEQICYRCEEMTVWEDGDRSRAEKSRVRRALVKGTPLEEKEEQSSGSTSSLALARGDDDDAEKKNKKAQAQEMLRLWYQHAIMDHSGRDLTEPHDVFAAVASIAMLAGSKIGSRYLAGLWEGDLVRGLLWRPRRTVHGASFRDVNRPVERNPRRPEVLGQPAVRAPSWSWAALEGPILPIHLARQASKYVDPSNFLIRPRHSSPPTTGGNPIWTIHPAAETDVLFMPACTLEFYSHPKRVRCSTTTTPTAYGGRHIWSNRRRMLSQSGQLVVLEAADLPPPPGSESESGSGGPVNNNDNKVVAIGCFDVADERVDECWCLPLIREEGLLLSRDADGGFRRLGLVSVVDLGWMVAGEEEEVRLV